MVTVTVDNFTAGALNPVLAYVVSCLGGFLGLRCVTRSQAYRGIGRAAWLGLAAVSIGATGIWAMHFIAMLGFTVEGQQMTYDVPKTLESMLLAVVVVGIGLAIVGYGKAGWPRIITGGTIIGLGVASMHYMGMEGMVMPDNVHYNMLLVVLSIVIAIVAGTAALWAGSNVETIRGGIGASMILGVAVVGMHYTGMAAMSLTSAGGMGAMSGTSAFAFVVPLVIALVLLTFGITMALLMGRSEEEIAEDLEFQRKAEEIDASWREHTSSMHVSFTGPQPRLDTPQDDPAPRPASGPATGPQVPPAAGQESGWQPPHGSVPRPGYGSGPQVRPSQARDQYLGAHRHESPER